MILAITSQITLVFIILTIIGTIVATIWMVLKFKKDIIETSETILKIGLALYATLIYVLFLYAHVFFSIIKFSYERKSYINLIIILVAIFPSFYLVFIYINLNKYFKKKFKLIDEGARSFYTRDREVESSIEKISKDLQLKKRPKVVYSTIKNISPFVFGKASKNSYIVLPANMEDIFHKISRDNKEIESSLSRFLILHELSHIKHRDHIFIGWAYSFIKSFKYWIVVILLVATLFSFILGLSQARREFGPIIFGIIYYLVLYLITMSVSRSREYLADARASLFMSERELEAITEPNIDFKGEKISYLENLFLWFSIFSRFKTSAIGISESQTWSYRAVEEVIKKIKGIKLKEIVSRYFNIYTHPNRGVRARRFKEKYFIGTHEEILSKGSSIWIGVILSLFYSVAVFYPLQTSVAIPSQGYLNFLSVMSLGDYFYFVMSTLILILFYVSFRNASALRTSFRSYLASLLSRFLIIYGTFLFTGVALNSMLYLNDKSYKFYKYKDIINYFSQDVYTIYPVVIGGFLLTSFIAFLHFNSVSFTYDVRKNEFNKLMSTIGSMSVLLIIFVFLLITQTKLSLLSIISGFFAGLTVFFYLDTRFPLLMNFDEMWELYGYRRCCIKLDKRGTIGISLLQAILTFFIPISIVSFITNLIGIHALYVIVAWGSLGLLLCLIIFNRRILKPSYSNITLFLESVQKYLYILKILGSGRIIENRESIHEKINKYRSNDYSYPVHKRLNVGTTNTCFNAINSLCLLQFKEEIQKSVEWLLGCENTGGGFSPAKGLRPRLSSTYEAISVLSKVEMLQKININTHIEWISSLQKERGFFKDSISRFPEIEQTYYALSSLYLLCKLETIDNVRCLAWTKDNWIKEKLKDKKKDIRSLFYTIKSLELLGALDKGTRGEIADDLLSSELFMLKNIKVDRNLDIFYYYFKIAEIVIADYKKEIKKLIPNLEDRTYTGFIYYLEKR